VKADVLDQVNKLTTVNQAWAVDSNNPQGLPFR